MYCVIVYVSASWRAREVSDYNRNFLNFMRKFCTFLWLCQNYFSVTYIRSSCFIWVHYMQWSFLFYDHRRLYILWLEICDHKFCYNKYHKIVIIFWKCGPFPNFHLLMFINSILLICLVYIVFCCLFLACLFKCSLFNIFVYGSRISIHISYEYVSELVYWLT